VQHAGPTIAGVFSDLTPLFAAMMPAALCFRPNIELRG